MQVKVLTCLTLTRVGHGRFALSIREVIMMVVRMILCVLYSIKICNLLLPRNISSYPISYTSPGCLSHSWLTIVTQQAVTTLKKTSKIAKQTLTLCCEYSISVFLQDITCVQFWWQTNNSLFGVRTAASAAQCSVIEGTD